VKPSGHGQLVNTRRASAPRTRPTLPDNHIFRPAALHFLRAHAVQNATLSFRSIASCMVIALTCLCRRKPAFLTDAPFETLAMVWFVYLDGLSHGR
jgi:hypothetical protein